MLLDFKELLKFREWMGKCIPPKPMGCNNFFMPYPDSKVHGANMGHIWGRQDPGGPHVGSMIFAIWVITEKLS